MRKRITQCFNQKLCILVNFAIVSHSKLFANIPDRLQALYCAQDVFLLELQLPLQSF